MTNFRDEDSYVTKPQKPRTNLQNGVGGACKHCSNTSYSPLL